jgi:hypothetical protein
VWIKYMADLGNKHFSDKYCEMMRRDISPVRNSEEEV